MCENLLLQIFSIFSHFRTECVVPGRSQSVRASVCGLFVSYFHNFDRFCLNFDHRDDTFLKLKKKLLWWRHNDFFALSRLQFLLNFLQTWSIFSSTNSFVWDCGLAFSANILYRIWPPKIPEKPLNKIFEKNE